MVSPLRSRGPMSFIRQSKSHSFLVSVPRWRLFGSGRRPLKSFFVKVKSLVKSLGLVVAARAVVSRLGSELGC